MNKHFTPLKNKQTKWTVGQLPSTGGNPAKLIWRTVFLTLLMLTLLLSYNTTSAQVYCTMVCNDNLNVSVGNECSVTIQYDQILEDGDNSRTCTPNGYQAFTIDVMDENLNVLPTSPTIPYEYVGRTLTVKVKHWATGNNCWATINLMDKIAPKLTCPADISIPCTESTDPAVTGQAFIADCGSGSSVTYEDVFTDLDCGNPIGKITRIWTAQDLHGNISKCAQIISIIRPNISNVLFPQNVDGITKPAISCVELSANSNRTKPEYTGYPSINGQAITAITGDICKLNVDFEDRIIDACNGSYKILRTWKVLNWCTSDLKEAIQLIKVADETAPVINVPADITVGTQTIDCFANVPLLPATITDACSNDISVSITSSFNTINANGGVLLNVPVGTHTIVYEATDACGNRDSKPMRVTVLDDDPPTVVCNDETVVSLNLDGTATVFATSFDGGSHDNCCLDKLLVRRVGDTEFGLSVKFLCTDSEVMVELQATDCHGNANSCMVNVSIQDKVAPSIVCPADQTIDCEADYSDLSQFGQPQVFDNCGFDIVESTQTDLDNCGLGTIKRTWTAMGTNGGGLTACTQTITLINAAPWNANNDQIAWPENYETSTCASASTLAPEDLPTGYNEPVFTGDDACALVATNYEDLVLDIEAPACFKILRTWTVIDWCQYEVNSANGKGRYEYEQVIKVIDNTAPTFASEPIDYTVDMLDDACGGTVMIPNVGISDCSPNATLTTQSALGSGFGPFTNVQPGVYDVSYIATDGCGNNATRAVKITVRDAKRPTPICIDGLVISMKAGVNGNPASTELWAKDLDAKSYDNCTLEANLAFRIRKYVANSTEAPGTTNITFACDEIGVQQVEVWVIDENGNSDFCLTTVDVQDNIANACSGGVVDPEGQIALSGKVTTAKGDAVSEVLVQISDPSKDPYLTGEDGRFSYEQLSGNLDYALIPEKNTAPKNGVSTLDIIKIRKHLIAAEIFDSPYKYIAADVDQSGTISTLDLIQTRKLILGLIDDFPNNESWRFVPVTHEFAAQENPLTSNYPEIAVVSSDAANKAQVDFMGIKIGDVDYSAQSNGLTNSESRNQKEALFFELADQSFEAGQTVVATFKANNFTEVLGYQFELLFEGNVIDYQSFKKGALVSLSEDNLGLTQVDKGKLRTSWDEATGVTLTNGQALFSIQFKAKKAGKLSEVLSLSSRFAPEVYSNIEEIYDLELNFNQQEVNTTAVELLQNQPNPFSQQTSIQFTLPSSQPATLTIYDVNGRTIKQYAADYTQGTHRITIEKSDLPTVGLMYYSLETISDKIVKKMILLDK